MVISSNKVESMAIDLKNKFYSSHFFYFELNFHSVMTKYINDEMAVTWKVCDFRKSGGTIVLNDTGRVRRQNLI